MCQLCHTFIIFDRLPRTGLLSNAAGAGKSRGASEAPLLLPRLSHEFLLEQLTAHPELRQPAPPTKAALRALMTKGLSQLAV